MRTGAKTSIGAGLPPPEKVLHNVRALMASPADLLYGHCASSAVHQGGHFHQRENWGVLLAARAAVGRLHVGQHQDTPSPHWQALQGMLPKPVHSANILAMAHVVSGAASRNGAVVCTAL